MSERRILVNTPYTVRHTFYGDEGLLDPDADAATVTVTKADGSTLVATTAATRVSQGLYEYTGDALDDLNRLTFTWTASFSGRSRTDVDYAEIVGGFYVSLAEIRGVKNLEDANKFDIDELRRARDWFETLAERYCNVAFVPRFARERYDGNGTTRLLPRRPLPIALLSARIYSDVSTYTAFDATDLADVVADGGYLTRLSRGAWTSGSQNLVLEYTHGYTTPPADLREAALVAIRSKLLNDNTGRPMLSVADGAGGTTRFAFPGPDRPTGIPDVDEALNGHRFIPVG